MREKKRAQEMGREREIEKRNKREKNATQNPAVIVVNKALQH